jgi:hypothetical protein
MASAISSWMAKTSSVVQGTRGLGFGLESPEAVGIGGQLRRQHLDGNLAVEPGVACPVDLTHPPGAERGEDLVGPEAYTGRERH